MAKYLLPDTDASLFAIFGACSRLWQDGPMANRGAS
jgi:hypothetical protein